MVWFSVAIYVVTEQSNSRTLTYIAPGKARAHQWRDRQGTRDIVRETGEKRAPPQESAFRLDVLQITAAEVRKGHGRPPCSPTSRNTGIEYCQSRLGD